MVRLIRFLSRNLEDYESEEQDIDEFDTRIIGGMEVEVLVPWFAFLKLNARWVMFPIFAL